MVTIHLLLLFFVVIIIIIITRAKPMIISPDTLSYELLETCMSLGQDINVDRLHLQ